MNARYRWLVIGIAIFLAAAALFDHTVLPARKVLPTKGIIKTADSESTTLQACDPSQDNYLGPLVPDLNNTGSESSLGEVFPDDKVAKSAWSSRAGFSISTPTEPEYWAQLLGSGWYLDWSVSAEPPIDGLEYWPMIRVHEECISPSEQEIRRVASLYPGQVWIIGNEPDVIWQDNVTPSRYAITYHDLYEMIKISDPTALIAVGGISQATPLRLQYLDQVLTAYQDLYHEPMPVDWWTVHGYVLREEKDSWGVDIPPGIDATIGELREVSDHGSIELFEAQIRSFRQWMAERGYQDTPLALTEFGILMPNSYGFPEAAIANYLERTFTWLSQVSDVTTGYPGDGYHLVQKWAWFSISDPTYSSSNLGDLASKELTLVGEEFRSIIPSLEK